MMTKTKQLVTIKLAVLLLCAGVPFQRVNLNAASKEQLKVLEGVGDRLAQRIIEHRESAGAFASLEDLLLIEGVKPKLLDKLRGKVEFNRVRHSKALKEVALLPAGPRDADLAALNAQFDAEPTIGEVQQEAVRYAMAEPSRAEAWLKRARLAPLLPKVSLYGGRGVDNDASLRERVGEQSTLTRKEGSDYSVNARVEWKLSELVFNRDELHVQQASFRMAMMRERLIDEVTTAFFERRKLKLEALRAPSSNAVERAEQQLQLEAIEALLNGLTGGWFAKRLQEL